MEKPEEKPKPRRGNPKAVKGGPSPNPAGRGGVVDDGVVTAAKMRKVLGQNEGMDRGPTEKRLREWLKKDVAKYQAEIERRDDAETKRGEMAAENAVLKERVADLEAQLEVMHSVRAEKGEVDDGTKRALEKIERILAEAQA